jgi:glycerol-3-phosphate acyltransferase PlsX
MSVITIALDGMGGDAAPEIVVEGAAIARRDLPDVRFLLYGDEARIAPLLVAAPAELVHALELRHTTEFVASDARPSLALRQGRNSSMRLAIDAVKAGEAAAAVSAGNTGALMAMAKVVLKTLPGIDRPAIAALLPTRIKPVVVLDLGANVDSDAESLFQFAIMGEVFARVVLDVAKPRLGLLNVGTEELKGDEVVKRAAAMLRDSTLPIDFCGFVEGHDVTEGVVDVVVTDGFTGNVALKIAEGTAAMFTSALRQAFTSSWRARLGYLIARPALRQLRDTFEPRRYNGAMFLGLNGVVVKSHGGTDAIGFANAIGVAANLVRRGANKRIIDEVGAVAASALPGPKAAAS